MEMTTRNIKETLPYDDESEIIKIDEYNNYIHVNDFIHLFEGAKLTHQSLVNHDNATDGWKNQFNIWKQDDILH